MRGATANVTADMNYGDGFFWYNGRNVCNTQSDANGHGIFEYSPNDGGGSSFDGAAKNFYAMNTENMKVFQIMATTFHPKDYFKTLTYTGNAGTNGSHRCWFSTWFYLDKSKK